MSTAQSDVLALVNKANAIDLSVDRMRFTLPVNNPDSAIAKNTKSIISTRKGLVPLYWDRRDLGVLFQQFDATVYATVGEVITHGVIAERLAARYGLRLAADDVVANTAVNTSSLPVTVTLRVVDNNFAWVGSLPVHLTVDPSTAV